MCSKKLFITLKISVLVLVFMFPLLSMNFNKTVTLNLSVSGIEQIEGQLVLALFSNQEEFLKTPIKSRYISVKNKGIMKVEWHEIPNVPLALSIFHDLNGNGKLDTNLLGIPTEPFGFGNNAKIALGPPSWKECLIIKNQEKEGSGNSTTKNETTIEHHVKLRGIFN